jgi:D-alanine-D-alanine ligase
MNVAVVFDTPYRNFGPDDHAARMREELTPGRDVEAEMEYQVAGALEARGHKVKLIGVYDEPTTALEQLRTDKVDVVFNAAEGFQQRDQLDYLLPALLEAEGHPYTGSPPLGLMVTRNKAMSKKVLSHHGVRVPKFLSYRLGDEPPKHPDLRFPAIVKPLQTDGSEGISLASVVNDADKLAERVAFVHERLREPAIVEEFIDGRELYVGVLGNGKKMEILPTLELIFDKEKTRPEERIATRTAKWNEGYRERYGIKAVGARPLSKLAQERIEHAVRAGYEALWLRDYARFDLRLDDDDEVWVLEANANPYISEGHELADAAAKAGIGYQELIERIVKQAAARDPDGI